MALEAKQTLIQLFEAFAKMDRPKLKELLADDVEWIGNGPPEMMGGGSFHSADEVLQSMSSNVGGTTDIKIVPQWMVAEGDKVVVLVSEQATVTKTGRFYGISSIHVYTVRNEKIVRAENFFDPTPILKATYDITYAEPIPQKFGNHSPVVL